MIRIRNGNRVKHWFFGSEDEVEESLVPTDVPGLITWIDGSDIANLYQDDAGSTPVTADGDVVGYGTDKSGNGNHFIQSVTANKPLYKTNIKNGLSALLFDGSNDYLSCELTAQLSLPVNVLQMPP